MAGRTASALSIIKERSVPPAPFYLIKVKGGDDYLCRQVIEILADQVLTPGFEEFNTTEVACQNNTPLGVLSDALLELPTLSEQRLLLLYQLQRLTADTAKKILPLLDKAVEEGQTVILATIVSAAGTGNGETAGRSALPPALKKWCDEKALNIDCALNEEEMADWIVDRLQQLGKEPSPQVIRELCDRSGNDLQNLASQLEKLCAFVGEGTITPEAVRRTIQKSTETKAWEFTSAVAQGNIRNAMICADAMLSDNPAGGAAGLISYTNSYLRSLAQIMSLTQQGHNAKAIAAILPKRKEYQIRKSQEELRTWTEHDLNHAFISLCRSDLRLKTGADPYLTINLLVLHLCRRQGLRRR